MTPKQMLAAGVPLSKIRRHIRTESAKYGRRLLDVPIPRAVLGREGAPVRVLRSRAHLVQVFEEAGGMVRLSCQCADVDARGDWVDGITWDELQRFKAEAGYGDREAVEVYPPDADVVNVASIRHLWVLPEGGRVPFSWNQPRRGEGHP